MFVSDLQVVSKITNLNGDGQNCCCSALELPLLALELGRFSEFASKLFSIEVD